MFRYVNCFVLVPKTPWCVIILSHSTSSNSFPSNVMPWHHYM